MLVFTPWILLGLVLAVLASLLIGGLWYSSFLFGPIWMKELGLTPDKMKKMKTTPAQAISYAALLALVESLLLWFLFSWVKIPSIPAAALLAGLSSLTFFAVPRLVHAIFEDTSKKVWAISAAHELVYSLVAGTLIAWSMSL